MGSRGPTWLIAGLLVSGIGLAVAQQAQEDAATVVAPSVTGTAAPGGAGTASVKYLSGGAGLEERERLMAQWPQYPLMFVFSASDTAGAYTVPQSVRITNAQGAPVLEAAPAGPVLMVNLPPGEYRVQARGSSGAAQEKQVRLGGQPQRVDWRM